MGKNGRASFLFFRVDRSNFHFRNSRLFFRSDV